MVSITGSRRDDTVDLLDNIKSIMDAAVTEMKNVWFITTGLGDGVAAMVAKVRCFTPFDIVSQRIYVGNTQLNSLSRAESSFLLFSVR